MARTLAPGGSPQKNGATNGLLAEAFAANTPAFRRVLAWQIARTVLRLGNAGSMAILIGGLIMGASVGPLQLAVMFLLLALATGIGFTADRAQAEAETRLAIEIRRRAGEGLAAMPARAVQSLSAGEIVSAIQRHPEALATLSISHRVAKIMMAVGPFCAAAALFWVSWQAALTLMGLTPVMIVFFVLVGEAIRTRAYAREQAFGRLAGQFADRIRSLPTILANHALETEAAKLDRRLDTLARQTMSVLRIAFLNAGVIDFFSSLSIAVLAIFLGLGHLKLANIPGFHDLALWQSLFILMIAPDYFAPFRRYAEQYHAKADGLAAASALDRLLATPLPHLPGVGQLNRLASEIEPCGRGLIVLAGPSGSGKSTLLRRLAGLEPGAEPAPYPLTWIATDNFVPEGDLADAIAWGSGLQGKAKLLQAAGRLGLLDDALLPGGLEAPVGEGGGNLSGGQRLRVGLARALLAEGAVFADEPTAKLDAGTADLVRHALRDMATTRPVIVATHDPNLLRLADRRVDLLPEPAARLEAQSS